MPLTGSEASALLSAQLSGWYAAATNEAVGTADHPRLVAELCRVLRLDPSLAQRGLSPSVMLADALALLRGRLPAEATEVAPRVKAVLRAAYATEGPKAPAAPALVSPPPAALLSPARAAPPSTTPKRAAYVVFASPAKRPRQDMPGQASDGLKDLLVASLRDEGWRSVLGPEFRQLYFGQLCATIEQDRKAGRRVLPRDDDIFSAFNATPWDKVRVVLLGQDPYPGEGQAHGLSFSVRRGVSVPGSLRNIYAELEADIPGFVAPPHGNLAAWASQGVLLLNASLTVIERKINSHADIGWQRLTDRVIQSISEQKSGVVFLLWGQFARKKARLVDAARHTVIEAAHPSPQSEALWRGCRVFSKTNAALEALGQPPIDWQV